MDEGTKTEEADRNQMEEEIRMLCEDEIGMGRKGKFSLLYHALCVHMANRLLYEIKLNKN